MEFLASVLPMSSTDPLIFQSLELVQSLITINDDDAKRHWNFDDVLMMVLPLSLMMLPLLDISTQRLASSTKLKSVPQIAQVWFQATIVGF